MIKKAHLYLNIVHIFRHQNGRCDLPPAIQEIRFGFLIGFRVKECPNKDICKCWGRKIVESSHSQSESKTHARYECLLWFQ